MLLFVPGKYTIVLDTPVPKLFQYFSFFTTYFIETQNTANRYADEHFKHLSMKFILNRGVRAFVSQTEGWVFETQPRQILVVKTGSDSSTA